MNEDNQVQNEIDFSAEIEPEKNQNQVESDKKNKTNYEAISDLISDLDRRLRILEERYVNLRKKIQLTDENLLESERNFEKEIASIEEEITNFKKNMNDFSDKIVEFNAELQDAAKTTDLKKLEKYLLMWDPTNFITRNQLKEYLKERELNKDNEN